DGTSTKATFDVSYASDPPDAALNAGLGVGILLLVPTDAKAADGKVADLMGLEGKAIGGDPAHAIIFKKSGADPKQMPAWAASFKDGYSCAKAVPATMTGAHDTFAPADCTATEIKVDDLKNLKFPNWF